MYERITTINQEIQKVKFAIQQLKDTTEREKLKSQVSIDEKLISGNLTNLKHKLCHPHFEDFTSFLEERLTPPITFQNPTYSYIKVLGTSSSARDWTPLGAGNWKNT